jgi:hypothetical protein
MIFSSHRFGQLTKPADLILYVTSYNVVFLGLCSSRVRCHTRYMDDSKILECGTHNELMAEGGKYAELWNLQAQAFL